MCCVSGTVEFVAARLSEPLEWSTFAYSFGHRLVTVRNARAMSQDELSERSGIHRNQISNLERATSNREPHVSDPKLSTVYRLARALEVPPAYLLPDLRSLVPVRSAEQASTADLSTVETRLRTVIERHAAGEVANLETIDPGYIAITRDQHSDTGLPTKAADETRE
ncbi:helix-turn-helix domain-containing protein [Gordonia zhaorongruii]|nr:helix-turn-helix transcriptional regulator [Gordonia zhaorongruii]